MKRLLWALSPFAAGGLLWLTLGAAADLENVYFPSVRVAHTNYVNELVITNGATLNGVRQTAWPAGGGGFVGAVSNNVVSAGLLSVDATKTNGIAATASHVTSALGFTPLTNTAAAITNVLGFTGGTTTFLRSDGTQAVPPAGGGSAPPGTLITNGSAISTGDIVAYGVGLTNTAKATFANLTNALGFIPATNGVGGGSAPVGTVVNTGASTNTAVPTYTDATGTNIGPSTVTISSGSMKVPGTIVFGTGGESNSVDSMVLISRILDDSNAGNGHAFSDSTVINRTNRIAYNSFDARVEIAGTNGYDHYAGFQFLPYLTNTVSVSNLFGFYASLNNVNSTNYINWKGVALVPPAGNQPAGRNSTGLYIDTTSMQQFDSPIYIGSPASAGTSCRFYVPLQLLGGSGESRLGLGVGLVPRTGYAVDGYGFIASQGSTNGAIREAFIAQNYSLTNGSGSAFVAKIGNQTITNLFGLDGIFNTTYSNIVSNWKVKGDDGYLTRMSASQIGVMVGSNHTDLATSTLQVVGSMAHSISTGSAITLGNTNEVYLCNVDAQLVTLPSAVGIPGRTYTVKLVAPATTGTLTNSGSQNIDGALSYSLTTSNKFVRVISDNSNWWIIGNN